ncbi:Abhydrolase-4 domain-containing protein [Favolaschia claudopus]|uniref:Abhydrolase-4 domain-containing protein n=1 Tax=Favolaschia claudopus TaxID=2862362 RepID=A0AAW0E182_9AGAR
MPVGRLPLALATAAFCLSFLVLCFANPWTYDGYNWLRDDIPDASSLRSEAPQNALNKDDFSWDSISPSKDLIWHSCYLNKHCAKLKVPLDYKNSDASLASASIAMVRIHSNVSHESPSYRGPILFNPGGPGGSGVDSMLQRGALLSTIVGPEFDLIGFDPRGVGRSVPRVSIYKSRAERALRMAVDSRFISLNHSADSLARGWARGILDGQLAGERDDGNLRFINTDHTARDMLRIVEAHGLEKLQYWGFSYGTVLGATFAAMFPDKVGRLVIDGVVDSENYYTTDWSDGLIDTENAWMSFVNGCVAAGRQGCPFFAPTAAEILAKVDDLYASLRARPIPVNTELSSGLVDFSTLRSKIFLALYSPYATFPTLAQALADLSNGNGTALFTMRAEPAFECACDSSEYQFEEIIDAGGAIMCNDGKKISSKYEDLLAHYEEMSGDFKWADMWEQIRFTCLAWPDFPKDHFQGPFVANTSFPLLMVGNTADPVTPLWAAKKMSRGFAGSVVLTQDSPGHCSLAAPSICTQKHIRRYFLDGILPEPGTVCDVDGSIFPDPGTNNLEQQAQAILSVSAEDRNLMGTVWELAKSFDIRFPGYL